MDKSVLKIHSIRQPSFTIPITRKKTDISTIQPANFVYEDIEYSIEVAGIEAPFSVQAICINGNEESFVVRENRVFFPGKDGSDRTVFGGYFGFAYISVTLKYEDGEIVNYFSEYLSIKVRDDWKSQRVEKMLDFILEHQDFLLFERAESSTHVSDHQKLKTNNVESRLALAEEIARYYDNSIGYFSANSQYKIKEKNVVDHIEKLQSFSPQTLQYICTHPEYLKETTLGGGIRIAGRNLYPEKTLMSKNIRSFDTYENRALLGFLKKMRTDLGELKDQISKLLEQIPFYEGSVDGYMHSAWIIFRKTILSLQKQSARVQQLENKYTMLEKVYERIFRIRSCEELRCPPRKTEIFFSLPHYNNLFYAIYRWFSFSEYNFEEERFILDFIKVSSLYELYVLCKIIQGLISNNAEMIQSYEKEYIVGKDALYDNTNSINTFVFADKTRKYTLYYQPVIYNIDSRKQTGIGLYRNNSYSFESKKRGTYYTPDYVLKIEEDEKTTYYIGDAKYKRLQTVEDYDIAPTCYKYLTSVSTVSEEDNVEGLFIIYGKCNESDQIKSVYDFQLSITGKAISPKAFIVPLSE